jgi:putative tricarboxylic transport membrane protein
VNRNEKDRWSALFCLVVAIGICFGSVRLSLGEFHKPGPGFFSFWAGAILGLLSSIVFLKSFKGSAGDERKAFWQNPKRTRKMIYVIFALILYVVGLNYLGFFLSTLCFLGFLLRAIDPQRWLVVIAVSIFSTIISYGIFQYWLNVPFPIGILGF